MHNSGYYRALVVRCKELDAFVAGPLAFPLEFTASSLLWCSSSSGLPASPSSARSTTRPNGKEFFRAPVSCACAILLHRIFLFKFPFYVHRFTRGLKHKPKRLPLSFWGWLFPVYKTTEDELIRVAGFDAAMYMRIISFGALSDMQRCRRTMLTGADTNCYAFAGTELFLWLTILCCAAVLPVNLVVRSILHIVFTACAIAQKYCSCCADNLSSCSMVAKGV